MFIASTSRLAVLICSGIRPRCQKRGPILIQLPPSIAFDARVAEDFLGALRGRDQGQVACEPRHFSWFCAEAERLLARWRLARVAADPSFGTGGDLPSGWRDPVYFRLHGSPDTYWSSYSPDYLGRLARTLKAFRSSAETWCILDNTASGSAIANALDLEARLTLGQSR